MPTDNANAGAIAAEGGPLRERPVSGER